MLNVVKALAAVAVLSLLSCETTRSYTVQVTSSPPGAHVDLNGGYVGQAPLEIEVLGDNNCRFYIHNTLQCIPAESDGAINGFIHEKRYPAGWPIPTQVYIETRIPPSESRQIVEPDRIRVIERALR